MPKLIKPLNSQQVAALKPKTSPYRQAVDSNGLYVLVGTSKKSWVMRSGGESRSWRVIGDVAQMPLATARIEVGRLRSEQGTEVEVKANHLPTFKKAALDYIEAHENSWKSVKHGKQWLSTLTEFAFPVIGNKTVDTIKPEHVIDILKEIGSRAETAHRVRGRIELIIDSAWIKYRTGELYQNPAQSKFINVLMPVMAKKPKRKHHEAIAVDKMPGIFQDIWAKRAGNISYSALAFCILTASRSNEVRFALWSDIDWDAKLITIPAERMKAAKNHVVPLSTLSLILLRERKAANDESDLIFPPKFGEALSDMALLVSLKRTAGESLTVHGCRSTFRNWGAERGMGDTAMELSLAHSVGNSTVKAYLRTDLLEQRAEIMQAWADFLFTEKIILDSNN